MCDSNSCECLRKKSTNIKCSSFLLMIGSGRYQVFSYSAIEAVILFISQCGDSVSRETFLRLLVWRSDSGAVKLHEVIASSSNVDLLSALAFVELAKKQGNLPGVGLLIWLAEEIKKTIQENFSFSDFETLPAVEKRDLRPKKSTCFCVFRVLVIRLLGARKLLAECGFFSCLFSVDGFLGGCVESLQVAGFDLLGVSSEMRLAGCLAEDCDTVEALGNDMIVLSGGQSWERV